VDPLALIASVRRQSKTLKNKKKCGTSAKKLFSSFLFSLLVAPVRIHFRIGELLASPDLSLPLPPYPLLFLSGIFSFPFIFIFSREREWGRGGETSSFSFPVCGDIYSFLRLLLFLVCFFSGGISNFPRVSSSNFPSGQVQHVE
jgi:hypothetical protein